MIDIHNHILPGVDDGAKTVQVSLDMAKDAVQKGISTVVATPHHQNGHYNNVKHDIVKQVDTLNELFGKHDIPLTVLPGQEVRIYGEILEDLEKGDILTINHSGYLLLELPFDSVPYYADQLIYDIQALGMTPVIAHPERNRELLENPDKLYKYVSDGVLTQLTAGSLIGNFGNEIQRFSEQLIHTHLTHFIASDAHNMTNRTFQLKESYEIVNKLAGTEVCQILQENSYLLIKNMHVHQPEPIRTKNNRKLFGFF